MNDALQGAEAACQTCPIACGHDHHAPSETHQHGTHDDRHLIAI